MYGMNTTNLVWFVSYLNIRKQYIKNTDPDETMKSMECGKVQY